MLARIHSSERNANNSIT
uniref:Uncharacterized protein n=1 Tax=Anguilla anguilla TaxID=7936 RepID=A0A0E9UUV6_ANGAN